MVTPDAAPLKHVDRYVATDAEAAVLDSRGACVLVSVALTSMCLPFAPSLVRYAQLPATAKADQAEALAAKKDLYKLGPSETVELLGSGPTSGTVRLGTPVFIRNPDFVQQRESPMAPRYFVGVVTALWRAPNCPVASHVEASWLRETSSGSMIYLSALGLCYPLWFSVAADARCLPPVTFQVPMTRSLRRWTTWL